MNELVKINDDLKRDYEKVKKLLSLAENNDNNQERDLAYRKAYEIMKKHYWTPSDFERGLVPVERNLPAIYQPIKNKEHKVAKKVAESISKTGSTLFSMVKSFVKNEPEKEINYPPVERPAYESQIVNAFSTNHYEQAIKEVFKPQKRIIIEGYDNCDVAVRIRSRL